MMKIYIYIYIYTPPFNFMPLQEIYSVCLSLAAIKPFK